MILPGSNLILARGWARLGERAPGRGEPQRLGGLLAQGEARLRADRRKIQRRAEERRLQRDGQELSALALLRLAEQSKQAVCTPGGERLWATLTNHNVRIGWDVGVVQPTSPPGLIYASR